MSADVHFDAEQANAAEGVIAPVPRVTLQAFCETHDVQAVLQSATSDRRMDKVHTKVQMGGPAAAVEAFRESPTPNVIILETLSNPQSLIGHLDELAQFCDSGTKVIVIGHVNDVQLYRDLMRRGISDYLIAPINVVGLVRAVSELYTAPGAGRVGRSIAVIGSKGGVGASTVAHNVAWAIARSLDASTVIADLDIAFGTAGLNFNQDPPQGIAEAIFAPERLDANMLDRLLSRCSDNLTLLAAPAMLDRTCDLGEDAVDQLLELLRASVPYIVLDVPHTWTGWSRRLTVGAEEVAIVASPDLASLRNAKNLMDTLRAARPNDSLPKLVLNQTGVPKRPEIDASEFAKALNVDVTA
ncbi:MAG: AAA family ATPase, partial [Bosea sp. (in: a-proteobacteria)]